MFNKPNPKVILWTAVVFFVLDATLLAVSSAMAKGQGVEIIGGAGGVIGFLVFLIGLLGFNQHKVHQKLLNFLNKRGITNKQISDKELNDSLIYEKSRLFSAAIYLPAIMAAAGSVIAGVYVHSFLFIGLGCLLGAVGVYFVVLFYIYEYKSFKTVFPSLRFWQYFLTSYILRS